MAFWYGYNKAGSTPVKLIFSVNDASLSRKPSTILMSLLWTFLGTAIRNGLTSKGIGPVRIFGQARSITILHFLWSPSPRRVNRSSALSITSIIVFHSFAKCAQFIRTMSIPCFKSPSTSCGWRTASTSSVTIIIVVRPSLGRPRSDLLCLAKIFCASLNVTFSNRLNLKLAFELLDM